MNRDQKRFTISVTPELAAELTAVKQSSYPGVPRDAMFRDLIIRALRRGKSSPTRIASPCDGWGAGPHRSSFGSPGKRRQTETDRNTVKVRGGRYARCGHPWAAARTRHPMETAEQFWAFLTGSVQSGAGFSPYVIRS